MDRLSIGGRIYLGIGVVLGLLLIIAAASLFATSQLGDVFNDYQSTAKQSLVMNDLAEDLLEARLAAFAYRVNPSDDRAAKVESNIDEILALEKEAEELFAGDPAVLSELEDMRRGAVDYLNAFQRMTALQRERETIVATLSETGPKARKLLTSIMASAYEDGDSEAAYFAGIAQQELILGRFYAERFLLTNSDEAYDRMAGHLSTATQRLETLLGKLSNADRRSMASATIADLRNYAEAAAEVRGVIKARNQIRTEELDVVGPRLAADYEHVLDTVVARQNVLGSEGTATADQTLMMVAVFASAALLIGSVLALTIARWTSRSLQANVESMTKLAGGKLDIQIEGEARNDELGAMARALGVFKKNALRMQTLNREKEDSDQAAVEARRKIMQELQTGFGTVVSDAIAGKFSSRVNMEFPDQELNELAGGINNLVERLDAVLKDVGDKMRALANGKLDQRVTADYQGAFGELKDSVNRTGEQLAEIVAQISVATREVENAATEISSGTTDLAERTEQAASNLEETAASTEEMAATVKQNAENAKKADQLADNANQTASKGGAVVEQAVNAMSGIEGSAQKITDIIGVIDEIAFQTNLLALNASVEAARAGEAGKGFAVVAQEVRQLAQRSAQAASDIKNLIQDSNSQVKDGVQLVNQAGEALGEIVGSIGKVTEIVRDISGASQEQAAGVQEINGAINNMDQMTQQNSALVEESMAAARALSEQARKLSDIMGFFEVGRVSPSTSRAATAVSRPSAAATAKPTASPSVAMAASDDEGWAEF